MLFWCVLKLARRDVVIGCFGVIFILEKNSKYWFAYRNSAYKSVQLYALHSPIQSAMLIDYT